jgi:hypothetical protein
VTTSSREAPTGERQRRAEAEAQRVDHPPAAGQLDVDETPDAGVGRTDPHDRADHAAGAQRVGDVRAHRHVAEGHQGLAGGADGDRESIVAVTAGEHDGDDGSGGSHGPPSYRAERGPPSVTDGPRSFRRADGVGHRGGLRADLAQRDVVVSPARMRTSWTSVR